MILGIPVDNLSLRGEVGGGKFQPQIVSKALKMVKNELWGVGGVEFPNLKNAAL